MVVSDKSKEVFIQNIYGGMGIAAAAQSAGFAFNSYYNWRRSNKPEDVAYIERVDEALESRLTRAVDSLYKQALKGNVPALIFWLCNRDPANWKNSHYIRGDVEHRYSGEVTVNYREEYDKLQAEEDRLLNLLDERRGAN